MPKLRHILVRGVAVSLLALPPLPVRTQDLDSATVRVGELLEQLILDEDTDHDRKITIDDPRIGGSERGDRRFRFTTATGLQCEVTGTYYLSNLLQDLARARDEGRATATLTGKRIFAPPVERISTSIREWYWDGLTRTIDESGLRRIVTDEKTKARDGMQHLYVPASDTAATRYFTAVAERHPDWRLRVEKVGSGKAERIRLAGSVNPGLLALATGVPFVVPGGRFNEMYGWDSYFILLGLLRDGKVDAARSIVENFIYSIRHYGGVLNANRTYYLTRSQPPFFTSMVREVFRLIRNDPSSREWLRDALLAAIEEHRNVWEDSLHRTPIGLARYMDGGSGVPPEVEPGHFRPVFARLGTRLGINPDTLERRYRAGDFASAELDAYFAHDRAMRESGHDTSYRLEGICADLATVDLNALLYRYEKDLAELIAEEFGGELTLRDGSRSAAAEWERRASDRKWLLTEYLWDERRGIFCDYDFVRRRARQYVSATTFFPLWAGAATPEQARSLLERALPLLEMPGGIAGSTESSRGAIGPDRPLRQWDYPNGWAPHQILAWQGFRRYGFDSVASRLAYRWLYTIAFNACNYNGTIPEKFDVVRRTHEVFAEYGNVGTKFSYLTGEGFGWTNASFQVGLEFLPEPLRDRLNGLIPPEETF